MYHKIDRCRICGNDNLIPIIHLGEQALTGVFPKSLSQPITAGPLELVKCSKKNDADVVCDLVQLHHSFVQEEMYGANYGYRSGLNKSMVRHLESIVGQATKRVKLSEGDLIIDIGSNDGTLLGCYPDKNNLQLVGIDPTGKKFSKYYKPHIKLIPDFFSYDLVEKHLKNVKAKVVTSIAMFYDLEEPFRFVREVAKVLDKDGIWMLEQSYLPAMLNTASYDTICHEHLEYYALKQINWLMSKSGLKIIDVQTNDINGGSFLVTVAKEESNYTVSESVEGLFSREEKWMLDTLTPYRDFVKKVSERKQQLLGLIDEINKEGKKILGYGASTKGNVILQYCGITREDIPCIAEVNEDKFGSFTPFTGIPIVSEKDARSLRPDYFLVLPWHFREGICLREKEFLASGGKLIFPLPEMEIVSEQTPVRAI